MGTQRNQVDRDYHDHIAQQYHGAVVQPRSTANDCLFAHFADLIPKQGTMLDVGAGTGHMSLRYGKRFSQITLIDHSQGMLTQAAQNLRAQGVNQFNCISGDAIEILHRWATDSQNSQQPTANSRPESAQLITCVGFLHHLSTEQMAAVLTACAMQLDKNGVLILAEPVTSAVPEPTFLTWWNRPARQKQQLIHSQLREPDEGPIDLITLKSQLAQAGLVQIRERFAWEIFPRFSWQALNRITTWMLDKTFRSGGFIWAGAYRKKQ